MLGPMLRWALFWLPALLLVGPRGSAATPRESATCPAGSAGHNCDAAAAAPGAHDDLSSLLALQAASWRQSTSPGTKGGSAPGPVPSAAAMAEKVSNASAGMAVVVLLERPGSEPDVGYAGLKDRESGQAVRPSDSFAIGSATKMFTAVAVMQLAERRMLNLSSPVTDFVPAAIVDGLTGGNSGGLQVRHLLGHCSGMGDYLNFSPDNETVVLEYYGASREGAKNYTPADIYESTLQKSKPAFTLQSEGMKSYDECPYAAYSNTGYIMLGQIVEQASGKSWEDYVRSEIFAPANMSASFFLSEGAPSVAGYATGLWPGPVAMPPTLAWSAGAIVSTAADLARFLRGAVSGALFRRPETSQSWLEAPYHQFSYMKYGYGLMKIDLKAMHGGKGELIGHGGQTFGFHTALFYHTASDTVCVVLENDSQSLGPELVLAGEIIATTTA